MHVGPMNPDIILDCIGLWKAQELGKQICNLPDSFGECVSLLILSGQVFPR